jgi:hypothetical protein
MAAGDRAVEDEGTYAIDEGGVRRWLAPGDEVPEGWTVEGDAPAASEDAPKKAPAKKS